jgi:TRAP-type C4-dicarboxylate transport system substrate-binding protein
LDTLPEKQLALAAEVIRGAVKMGMLVNAGFQPHWIPKNVTLVSKAAFNGLEAPVQQVLLRASAAAEGRGWKTWKRRPSGILSSSRPVA